MKNNLCLFERPFKIWKNGVFLFELSFCVLEMTYGLKLKSGKYRINDISGNIEAMCLKLGIINVHHKRN